MDVQDNSSDGRKKYKYEPTSCVGIVESPYIDFTEAYCFPDGFVRGDPDFQDGAVLNYKITYEKCLVDDSECKDQDQIDRKIKLMEHKFMIKVFTEESFLDYTNYT